MTSYNIKKRNGELVPFNVEKIKKAIEWAAQGVDINTLELESSASLQITEGIPTTEIQKILISSALNLTNFQNNLNNLKWRIVAARLWLLDLYKEAKRTRKFVGFGYKQDYVEFLKDAISKGIYDDKIIQMYSEEELREASKEINMEYDLQFDYAGMNLLVNRYLMKDYGKTYELPQEMYLTISLLLASPEEPENRLRVAKQFYHAIASRKISPATPIILNLRRPEGNLTSCFITAMDDSLTNIYYTLDQIAQISKNAGGVGVNLSKVRSHGGYIRHHKGASGGVLPWTKLINDTAIAVNQLGSRAGAVTVALDIWHRDIPEFLEMQTENGDQRKKSFDIFPQIVFNDLFMKRVENNENWTLLDPHEIKKKKGVDLAEIYGSKFDIIYQKLEQDESLEFKTSISAKELFKKYLRTLVETGLPYAFFKDTTNKANPNKHAGYIGNANLCTESFSNFKPSKVGEKQSTLDFQSTNQKVELGEAHSCNLVSLNLALLDKNKELDDMTALATRLLDNTIELSKAPIPEAHKHNFSYRILGIGALGLADYLAKKLIDYSKAENEVDDLFERIALAGVKASNDLAKERGSYEYFEGSEWQKGNFFGRDKEWYDSNSKYKNKWKELRQSVKEHGFRNGGLFAIAPNTSTSLLLGASASILPIYKKFFTDKNQTGAVPICPPYLNQETFWFYKENQHIDQQDVISVVSTIQKWVDQGISMELVLNLNKGITAKDIYNLYMQAWKKGCKTVYYVRSITLSAEKTKEECVSCAN